MQVREAYTRGFERIISLLAQGMEGRTSARSNKARILLMLMVGTVFTLRASDQSGSSMELLSVARQSVGRLAGLLRNPFATQGRRIVLERPLAGQELASALEARSGRWQMMAFGPSTSLWKVCFPVAGFVPTEPQSRPDTFWTTTSPSWLASQKCVLVFSLA